LAAGVCLATVLVWPVGAASASPQTSAVAPESTLAGYTTTHISGARDGVTVTGEFVVPALTCTGSPSSMAQEIGFGMKVTTTVKGKDDGVAIIPQCHDGNLVSYTGRIVLNGLSRYRGGPMVAGDTVQLTIHLGSNVSTGQIVDLTRDWMITRNLLPLQAVQITVGAFAQNCAGSPAMCTPVPNFGNVTFDSVFVNHHDLASVGATVHQLVTATGLTEVTAGSIDSTGISFPLNFEASCSPSPSDLC
jgi:hypothetical protein